MANNQNDRTPQNVSGQDQQKPQQGMPRTAVRRSKPSRRPTATATCKPGKSGTDQAQRNDQNQKR